MGNDESGGTAIIRILHPSGWVEATTVDEIREVYGMSLDEYRYFVAAEPEGAAARNTYRRRRREEVQAGTAKHLLPNEGFESLLELIPMAECEAITNKHDERVDSRPVDTLRSIRSKTYVVQTPINPGLSEEERRRRRLDELLFSDRVHPGVLRKGTRAAKTSYYVPKPGSRSIRGGTGFRGGTVNELGFAEKLIAVIPFTRGTAAVREYWEGALLNAYYHLFDVSWPYWHVLIPWLRHTEIPARAAQLGCNPPWDWMTINDYAASRGVHWSRCEVESLIAWYPERQTNNDEQRVFVKDRSFAEIKRMATILGLPAKTDLEMLAQRAQTL